MTGLENQREFGVGPFTVSEQDLRHAVAVLALILATVLCATFFSSFFVYALVAGAGICMVIAFLVDTQHEKLEVDELDQ